MFNVRIAMSAPLSRKNLPETPTPDDILNAFLGYLQNFFCLPLSAPFDFPKAAMKSTFLILLAAAAAAPFNILFIISDDHSATHMGCYGERVSKPGDYCW